MICFLDRVFNALRVHWADGTEVNHLYINNMNSYNCSYWCITNALYLNVNVFSMKVLIGDTIFTPPTREGTAILYGDLSHGKFEPFSREGHYLDFSFILRPWECCIGLAPRIEPTTFHSAVKCSNDWADSVVVKQSNFSQYPQKEWKEKDTADKSEVQSAYISNETLCF